MRQRKYTLVLLAATLLFSGCRIEQPTVKNYRRVVAMDNLTPVTVAQLRQIIATDTTHYKVVVLTSSCCGPCEMSMRDVYPKKMAECDSSKVRWLFVEERYSTAQYMGDVLRSHHLNHPRYWINDTLPQYRTMMMKNMWTTPKSTPLPTPQASAHPTGSANECRYDIASKPQIINSQPTLPSRLMLSSFCASTANSIGSFFSTSLA